MTNEADLSHIFFETETLWFTYLLGLFFSSRNDVGWSLSFERGMIQCMDGRQCKWYKGVRRM